MLIKAQLKYVVLLIAGLATLHACSQNESTADSLDVNFDGKPVVYQVFTRLFGNTNTRNKPWGTIEENGVGKFSDFSNPALAAIRDLGVSHIWYTGVPHHAVIRDYTQFGISNDDPDVVKGRAGSPYAVKDYYNVNPDLADDPAARLDEFRALIKRTHDHGMQVIIDIVPNHVARGYDSTSRPAGIANFGANDDTSVEYARDNNFYYVVGADFQVPDPAGDYEVLDGEPHPLADGQFSESPAKWTGNGARAAKPSHDDWYETVKVNYGVRPDGSYDFPRLPADYANKGFREHVEFWRGKDVPDSWEKFRDIALYWTEFGVDGFRYDMAEMVPVEFWSYLNSAIRTHNEDAFLLAEVYNPDIYREYIQLGLMDYLYDKVGFYDTLKRVMQGSQTTQALVASHQLVIDIEQHMLHFLENHDEQRIASKPFAGDARLGLPAMAVSALISRAPTMLYFGQELGEKGDGEPGFGAPSRTSIFDYWGVPAQQRWMNNGKFDGGQLTASEQQLRAAYRDILRLSANSATLLGQYAPLRASPPESSAQDDKVLAFARWQDNSVLFVASNFDRQAAHTTTLNIEPSLIEKWRIPDGDYALKDHLNTKSNVLNSRGGQGRITLTLAPLQSVAYELTIGD